jgi:hypothetical protein
MNTRPLQRIPSEPAVEPRSQTEPDVQADSHWSASGSSPPLSAWCQSQLALPPESEHQRADREPPELNVDVFGPDAPDPLARALERAKASAGALAEVLVACSSEGHDPGSCEVARSITYGAAQDLAWLQELSEAAQLEADRAFDDGFPAEIES